MFIVKVGGALKLLCLVCLGFISCKYSIIFHKNNKNTQKVCITFYIDLCRFASDIHYIFMMR